MLLALLVLSPAPAPWRAPVDAPVAARFAYSSARPFARGQRRGIDFAAPAGAHVVAPCPGRVAHAGPVPGRGLGVTLRCGRLTATVLGLASLSARAGTRALPGQRLGLASGVLPLRLGARVTGRRFGYVDPLGLLRARPPRSAPPVPLRAPRSRARRAPPPPVPARIARPRARRLPIRAAATAWLGAGLLATALTAGVALPGRRRRRRLAPAPSPSRPPD